MREKDKELLYSFLLFIVSLLVFLIFPHLITLIALGFFSYAIFYEIITWIFIPEKAFDNLKPKTEEEKVKRQKIFWGFIAFLFLLFIILPFVKDVSSYGFDYLITLFGFLSWIYNNYRKKQNSY